MTGERIVVGSCPLDCPDTCSWHVHLDSEGRPKSIRGNPDHPFTQGGLCPKVNPWLTFAADPSRVTRPMRRVGAKGEGRFEPITWDDALAEMADRFTTIIERSGGAAIWPFVGTGNLGWLQGLHGPARVWRRMGASAHNMSICSVAGRVGINLSVGAGDWLDAEAFAQAGLIIAWGSNTLVTNRHLWPFIEQARSNGAPLVVVDPLRTRTADRADFHLAPTPGTDGALALAICAELVRQDAHDERFLEQRTLGWPEFRDSLADWPLSRAAAVTGVDAADIASLADLIAQHRPLALRLGHGIQRHAAGGQAMRTVACIPAIVGAYDQHGGGSLYSSSGTPKGWNIERHQRPELGDNPRTLVHTNLGRNLVELDDPPVEALVVWCANPAVSNPQLDQVRQGLSREDLFTVVIDLYPTETAAYADLLLPSAMQHEQIEINDSYNHRYLQWNEPAVEPPGDALPHTEIFRRLAAAMGYDEPELFASDDELAADLLSSAEFAAAGLGVETLRSAGFLPLPGRAEPWERAFPTPSGRFEFTSATAEKLGHDRLPSYRPPLEATLAGRLSLVAAAGDLHVNSTFAGTERVTSRAAAPKVRLHPDDALTLGISDGAQVEVGNQRGSFVAIAQVSDAIRPGVVASSKGWWGQGVNETTLEHDADMGGGAIFHDNAVTVHLARNPGR